MLQTTTPQMNPETARMLQQIGEAFRIEGPFFSYEEIKMGNVNRTYKVNYVRAENGMAKIKSYLVQRVNTYAFRKPVELMQNIDRVTEHIRGKNPNGVNLHFHHTADRRNYLMENDGFWRLLNYVPSVTYNATDDEEMIRNAGEAFGDFQMQLSDFDANLLYYTIPDFHDTPKRYDALLRDAAEDPCGRVKDCGEELAFLTGVRERACRLTELYRAGRLPLRVTHNDTKINNVLFDVDTHRPLVVIDLDTVMPGLVGHDFGDAIRFAANFAEEDCPDTAKVGLDLNTFWAFTEGFLSKTAQMLTHAEIDTLAESCFTLACELATRFLDDYIVGDRYFNIKSSEHNLVRTKAQIALAKDMLRKMDAMHAIVRECAKKYR